MNRTELAKFISNAGIDLIIIAAGLFFAVACIGAALWLLNRPP